MCSRYLIRASLDPPESISKMAFRSVQLFSIGSAVFAQLTAEEYLYFLPRQIAHSHGDLEPPRLIHGYSGPPKSITQMAARLLFVAG